MQYQVMKINRISLCKEKKERKKEALLKRKRKHKNKW